MVSLPIAEKLAWFFRRNGYMRVPDEVRRSVEGHWSYKKGYEVRLVARSKAELALIRRLLRQAGFKPGRPFVKGRQLRQPLYGREAVTRFLALIGAAASAREPSGSGNDHRQGRESHE